ncbi:MAG: integrase core domain-containing protein, partial [Nitrososphaerales archaeon]
SKLSRFRDIDGCMRAFNEAKNNAHGQIPETVFTDNWAAYKVGVPVMLPDTKLIANSGIKKPHANNNRIERMNGTLRERVKVQRGWKSFESQIAEGQRIHYNFVKPHMALEGMTPAQRAGIPIENKWLELLKRSITTTRTPEENTA